MNLSTTKKVVFAFITLLLVSVVLAVIGELTVRLVKPQRYMYPRWKFSEKYGTVIYSNVTIMDELRGKWKFTYKINEQGYRGPVTPISNRYDKKNMVILGDSFSFGMGVNEGEEYASILRARLGEEYNIINLASGGYGLTQEIRLFYEYGQLFLPKIVILQFCANDPQDNFFNKVTVIENGRFVFKNTNNKAGWTKKYLSRSIIQKSELYNLFREGLYGLFKNRTIVDAGINPMVTDVKESKSQKPAEEFYISLLDLFAGDLSQRGIDLFMIAVNGHLGLFPRIKQKVEELDQNKCLKYVEVMPWFENTTDYGSPEGHGWGKKAHAIIGDSLAEIINGYDNSGRVVSANRIH